jgi:hypothetical protein
MKNLFVLSVSLFALGFGLLNGFNNNMPTFFISFIVCMYIILPVFRFFKLAITKKAMMSKNTHHMA